MMAELNNVLNMPTFFLTDARPGFAEVFDQGHAARS
jgi:hypothetical protein